MEKELYWIRFFVSKIQSSSIFSDIFLLKVLHEQFSGFSMKQWCISFPEGTDAHGALTLITKQYDQKWVVE